MTLARRGPRPEWHSVILPRVSAVAPLRRQVPQETSAGTESRYDTEREFREIAARRLKYAVVAAGFALIVAIVIAQALFESAGTVNAALAQSATEHFEVTTFEYFPDQYTNQATVREEPFETF